MNVMPYTIRDVSGFLRPNFPIPNLGFAQTTAKIGPIIIRHISEKMQVSKLLLLILNSVILPYFAEFGSFGANYVTVAEISCLRQKCIPKKIFSAIRPYDVVIFVDITEKSELRRNILHSRKFELSNTAPPSQQ